MTDTNLGRCFICGEGARAQDPLCPDGMDDEVLIHLRCLNSPEARAWRDRKQSEDPVYARYWMLRTLGLDLDCPSCAAKLSVGPKAVGMGAGAWSVYCLKCSNRVEMLGYPPTTPAYDAMPRLGTDFEKSRRLDEIPAAVAQVAARYDDFLRQPCPCGGRFSLAAKPRCPECNGVAFDSYFHDVWRRPHSASRKDC